MVTQIIFILAIVALGGAAFFFMFRNTGISTSKNAEHFSPTRFILRSDLDFARNVAKRLDEHRELVTDLIEKTDYLIDVQSTPWRAAHLATQDDYLMYLFYLRHGVWPTDTPCASTAALGYVRPRPGILGQCGHPLYELRKNDSSSNK